MKSTFKKGWVGIIAVLLAFLMTFTLCLTACSNGGKEITFKGKTGQGSDEFMGDPQDVYWLDASVQKPNSYTKIVGFKLTVKMTKIDYYGGGKEDGTFACGMILTTRGAHEPSEYVFTYPNGQSPSFDLSTKNVAVFGVGEAGWLVGNVFSGSGISSDDTMQAGDTATLFYNGETAIFAEGDPILTVVSFLGEFEYQKVEWILGEPEELEEVEWSRVEVTKYDDVSTVPAGVTNNGNNYVDITIPNTNQTSYPVVLWIHGGGYITGSRKNCLLDTTKEYMLAQGYAWVSADYTLTQTETVNNQTVYKKGGMPQMLYDLKTAVRFLRANATQYKLDTDYIVAMGESAGAGLALLMATSNDKEGELYEDTTMGWADQSSEVQAAAAICPPTSFTGALIDNMSAYIGADYNEYFEAKKNNFAGYDAEKKKEIENKAKAWSPANLITVNTVPLFMSFSKEDTTVPQAHFKAIKESIDRYFKADEAEAAGIVINNYSKGGHVDRGTFDSYSAYVALANWCNAQRDKAAE